MRTPKIAVRPVFVTSLVVLSALSACGVQVVSGVSSGGGDAQPKPCSGSPEDFFEQQVYPVFDKECGACHATGEGQAPLFLGADAAASYTTVTSYGDGMLLAPPDANILIAKSVHAGPDASAGLERLFQQWLSLELTGTCGSGSSGSAGSASTGSGPTASDCASYCAEIAANCAGANEQYAETESCMGVCAAFPPGTRGEMSGNSLACRAYHAAAAKMEPATHCGHAGPTGGDLNPEDQSPGPCGEACDSFCTVAIGVCTGDNQAFKDMADCLTQCRTFKPATVPYSMSTWNAAEYTTQVYTLAKAADLADSVYLQLCHDLGAQP